MAENNPLPLRPEEEELASKTRELKELESQLVERELELAELRGDLANFERVYNKVVGILYAELDEIEARSPNESRRTGQPIPAHEGRPKQPASAPSVREHPLPRLAFALAKHSFPTGTGEDVVRLTPRIVVVSFPSDGKQKRDLFDIVDLGIIALKGTGRGGVADASGVIMLDGRNVSA